MSENDDPKSLWVSVRLPKPLLDAVKARAQARGITYQRFIREMIAGSLDKRER